LRVEERSAGAVVFKEGDRGRQYLLLQNAGRWDFPKGGVEEGESELETALREVREETGLDSLAFVPGFRRVVEYFYRREKKSVHKQVVYLLARAGDGEVMISHEHQGFGWFSYHEAIEQASYDNSKKILADAERFIRNPGLRPHNSTSG
jgi:bis(5'-nucleosidyl)-tetraphosphatase